MITYICLSKLSQKSCLSLTLKKNQKKLSISKYIFEIKLNNDQTYKKSNDIIESEKSLKYAAFINC